MVSISLELSSKQMSKDASRVIWLGKISTQPWLYSLCMQILDKGNNEEISKVSPATTTAFYGVE